LAVVMNIVFVSSDPVNLLFPNVILKMRVLLLSCICSDSSTRKENWSLVWKSWHRDRPKTKWEMK